jgi:hypothetical protein
LACVDRYEGVPHENAGAGALCAETGRGNEVTQQAKFLGHSDRVGNARNQEGDIDAAETGARAVHSQGHGVMGIAQQNVL